MWANFYFTFGIKSTCKLSNAVLQQRAETLNLPFLFSNRRSQPSPLQAASWAACSR